MRPLTIIAGVLLLAIIGCSLVWLSVFAQRSFRAGRWLVGGLALLAAAALLVPALVAVDMLGFALFWES